MATVKVCKACKISKDLEAFALDAAGRLGRRTTCKACINTRSKGGVIVPAPTPPVPDALTKRCRTCDLRKPLDDFTFDSKGAKNCRGTCKACEKIKRVEIPTTPPVLPLPTETPVPRRRRLEIVRAA